MGPRESKKAEDAGLGCSRPISRATRMGKSSFAWSDLGWLGYGAILF